MRTINDIYNESILGDPSTYKDRMRKNISDYENQIFNRLIKIIVEASGMSRRGEMNFRKVMDKLSDKYPYFTCYISTDLRCNLQALSKKSLTKNIFDGFPNSKKEQEFNFYLANQIISNPFPQVHDFIKDKITYAIDDFSVIGEDGKGNDIIAGTFTDDTKIVVYDGHICIWFKNFSKMSIRFLTEPTQRNSRNTR